MNLPQATKMLKHTVEISETADRALQQDMFFTTYFFTSLRATSGLREIRQSLIKAERGQPHKINACGGNTQTTKA